MSNLTELKNIVRIGRVQSVNKARMTARVKFADKSGLISGELQIVTRPRKVIPGEGGGEDMTAIAENHFHPAYINEWTPEIGNMVLCLFIPDGDGDGFVLGKVGT